MKRLRFLLIIPVFLCFIIVYLISNAFLRRDEPLIHNYIPDEVDVLIEFDIKHFGSAFMYNMLYNSEYFNEKIPLPDRESRGNVPSMGVSPANNFVFAIERWGSGDFYYFIFQLDSKREFESFLNTLQEKNENLIHVSNQEVGIFGFTNNVDKEIASKYLDEVIHKNVESIRTKYDLKEKFNWDRDLNIHLNTQAFIEGSKLQDIFASVDLVSSSAIMDIQYLSNDEYKVEPLKGKILRSKNLHISSTMKFEDILRTLGMKTSQRILDFPKIKKWSMNNLGSLIEMQTGVKADSVNEVLKVKSPQQTFLVDSKDKFGIYLPDREIKVALNVEDKFEILLEPESEEDFNQYMKVLVDSNVIQIDTSKGIITMGQFGQHHYKWIENYFIIYPMNGDEVELVDVNASGSYFYMDFELNPFFKNVSMSGDGTMISTGGVLLFNSIIGNFNNVLNSFDRMQVSLFTEGDVIKIHSNLTFKNTEGVAIIEMMSAFLNSNFKDFFF